MIAHSIVLSAITSFALLGESATALAMPESAHAPQAKATSGINVEAVCNTFFRTSFSAVATGNGCNDWVCVCGNERHGIDFNEWCSNNGGAHAQCRGGVLTGCALMIEKPLSVTPVLMGLFLGRMLLEVAVLSAKI